MTQVFNNALLLLARQYRGMSQGEVAQACGLNQGHYSRIENGLLPDGPSDENAERIAVALGFPKSFFYLSSEIAGLPMSVHPFNRKKASLGEKLLKSIHAELNIRLIHVRRFLRAVDLSPELPLPWIDVDEGGGPARIARTLRTAWGIPDGPIANLTAICERAGVLVIPCEFDPLIDGVAMRVRDLPPCVFINRRAPADRTRFSLAHELGHIIMHRIPTDTIEEEANAFAAEFLVPERGLKKQLIGRRVTLEVLAREKAFWKVSMNFLLYRANSIGFLNSNQAEYLWKQMSIRGWRTHEPPETEFEKEAPSLFSKIVRLHTNDLGYGVNEFAQFLHVNPKDVHTLYGDSMKAAGKPKLYVVRR
jgi:Zn-dependent peptidase ImmA (M78 family)/transcriptional regulator with XRE-family HTH domain